MIVRRLLFWFAFGVVALGLIAATWFVSMGVSWAMERLRLPLPRWLAACIALFLVVAGIATAAHLVGIRFTGVVGVP